MADIIKINENTWSIEDVYVRFFLLEGAKQAVLIDSGINCNNAIDIAKSLTDKPLILLNTHGDGDHTSGTGGFDQIHMHKEDYINCGVNVKFPKTSLVGVDDGDIIDPGLRPLKIIYIPGHTKGSVAILDVNNRALYAGDSVQKGHIYMFGKHRDVNLYEAYLDKLIAIKDEYDVIYASHDERELPNDYSEKVKVSWQQVRKEEVSFEMMELHGCNVKSYTTDYCGFYVE